MKINTGKYLIWYTYFFLLVFKIAILITSAGSGSCRFCLHLEYRSYVGNVIHVTKSIPKPEHN